MKGVRSHEGLLSLAFLLSGAAGLGYEMLWTRLLALGLGSEMSAVLGVLAGFFGGLALGSALLHGRVMASRAPARLFAVFEVIAAAWALLSPWLLLLVFRDMIVSLQNTFAPSFIMTYGGPDYATTFVPLLVYELAFDFIDLGLASALLLVTYALLGAIVFAILNIVGGLRGQE